MPQQTVAAEIVWAALDCPGGWYVGPARPADGARDDDCAGSAGREPASQCVVVGRLDETGERRSSTSTALYGADGQLLARAEAVWVRVDPEVFNRLESRVTSPGEG